MKAVKHKWIGEKDLPDLKKTVFRIEPSMSAIDFINLEEEIRAARQSAILAAEDSVKYTKGIAVIATHHETTTII